MRFIRGRAHTQLIDTHTLHKTHISCNKDPQEVCARRPHCRCCKTEIAAKSNRHLYIKCSDLIGCGVVDVYLILKMYRAGLFAMSEDSIMHMYHNTCICMTRLHALKSFSYSLKSRHQKSCLISLFVYLKVLPSTYSSATKANTWLLIDLFCLKNFSN